MHFRISVAASLLSLAALASGASVPNPKVSGPIPANAPPGDPSHDYPFFCTSADLASYGYVEEEFFFEGTSNRYNTPALATGSIIDSGHPYRTRMVVRRPASAAGFSGIVMMEVFASGPAIAHDIFWLESPDRFMSRGHAWIGVSVLQAGIHTPVTGLKDWSPVRYGALDVTGGGTVLDDGLFYDILSQAAQAVRSPKGVDPMGGFHVERLLAAGGGTAANRLATYYNSIHPFAGIFDGFLFAAGGGRLRGDLEAKAFKILAETSVANNAVREPDSDHFRRWEVAGSAAIDLGLIQGLAPLLARDNIPPLTWDNCGRPALSRIPFVLAGNAAMDHLIRWVKDNVPPPAAPELEVASPGPPVVIARDTYGNALGGIRLPQHAVPTAANTGVNSGPGLCSSFGTFQPFDAATLTTLYPDHMTYVIQVIQATLDNLKAGFLAPEDAAATISDAVYSDIGR